MLANQDAMLVAAITNILRLAHSTVTGWNGAWTFATNLAPMYSSIHVL
jgi:hypothetical protein